MSISAHNDPTEGWQKQLKAKFQKAISVARVLFRKALVHRQTLVFFINMGFGLFKLVKFILSFF
ncbi:MULTISPECIES: hypothetical protein [Brevundimonas]|uniref:Uncharacterized protein n=1 Tax=Brevundimonas faecalis TaxID=947378 RepID=A0ABV2R840_9CAUL